MLLGECTGCLVLFPLHSSPHVTVWSGFTESSSGCAVTDWERWTLLFSTRAHHHPSLQITYSMPPHSPLLPVKCMHMSKHKLASCRTLTLCVVTCLAQVSAHDAFKSSEFFWKQDVRCQEKKILTFIEYIVYYPLWLWINKNIQDNVSKRFMIYIYLL